MFLIGFTLYVLGNKTCCKTISTNFPIVITLAATVGVSFILLSILNRTETSTNDFLPAISGGTLIEQLLLFLLFVSSSKVCNSLKKMFVQVYIKEKFLHLQCNQGILIMQIITLDPVTKTFNEAPSVYLKMHLPTYVCYYAFNWPITVSIIFAVSLSSKYLSTGNSQEK